jgi:hypothetical protein
MGDHRLHGGYTISSQDVLAGSDRLQMSRTGTVAIVAAALPYMVKLKVTGYWSDEHLVHQAMHEVFASINSYPAVTIGVCPSGPQQAPAGIND